VLTDRAKLATYQLAPWYNPFNSDQPGPLQVTLLSSDQYFGGRRLAVMDELGSAGMYYPWGENRGTTNPQNTWGFGTYWEDQTTGLDYAMNRYYSNAYGRFMTPDPYQANGGGPGNPQDPQSWNKYSYTRGDPVNRYDPEGTCDITTFSTAPDGTTIVNCTDFMPAPQTGWQWAPPQTGLPFNPQPTSATFNTLCGPITYYAGMTIPPSCLPCPAGQVRNPQGACINVATAWSETLPGTNWCGPGGKGPVLDAVDALCYLHEACYAAADANFPWTIFPFSLFNSAALAAAINSCNQQLCQQLLSLPSSVSSPLPSQEINQVLAVNLYFGCVP
jgi:RHS repeat-associated protein